MKHTRPLKLTWMAASLALCGLWTGHADAQSSVTLYGTVDAGVVYTTNQQVTGADGSLTSGHAVQMSGGNLVPSRWGLTGTEDLGGTLKATFSLENQFLTGSGAMLQNGALFNRQAWVGLRDERIGTLGLGRQYDSYSDFLGVYASSNNWATLYGAHFGDVDNLNEAFNMNNAIKFTSVDFNGFTFGGTFSLGGQAGNFATRRGYALAAAYTHGPVSVSAGYMTLNDPFNAALGGANGYIGDFSCANAAASYCQLQNARSIKAYGAGGSLVLGDASVALVYTHTRLEGSQYFASAASPGGRDVSFDIAEVNLTYAFTPAWNVGAAYIFNNVKPSGTGSTHFHQINLGTNYLLSKRTALYAVAIAQQAGGAGLGTDASGATANYAQIPNLVNSNSDRQLAVIAGIRVNF